MTQKMIRKTFHVERKTIDAEAGIYEAVISTEEQDRDGDVIRAAGADLTNFLRNPVVLAGHDYRNLDAVVGKALEVTAMPGTGIRAKFQFAPAAVNPKADIVRRLWDAEFLNATSIGFIPKEAKPLGGEQRGYDFQKWELLEFSIVSVPSNQSALAIRALEESDAPVEPSDDAVTARALELLQRHLDIDASDAVAKRGRVLSAANEQKLKAARDALNDVLAQLEREDAADANAGADKTLSTDNSADTESILKADFKPLNGDDQKEVEPPSLPAEAAARQQLAADLTVELRQMVDAVKSVFASRAA